MNRVLALSMNEEEKEAIKTLSDAGVLIDPSKHHFEDKHDFMIICCPDGTKFKYTLSLINGMYPDHIWRNLHYHTHTRHGGGLVLSKNSPIAKKGHTTDVDLLADIQMSVDMGYKSIILLNHLPCKMARLHNIAPLDVVGSLASTKRRIKENIKDITVACFLQATKPGDIPGEISEVFHFFSVSKYDAWEKKQSLAKEGVYSQEVFV
mgnify:CR=1 FL=1